jgi:hypothetical protein
VNIPYSPTNPAWASGRTTISMGSSSKETAWGCSEAFPRIASIESL